MLTYTHKHTTLYIYIDTRHHTYVYLYHHVHMTRYPINLDNCSFPFGISAEALHTSNLTHVLLSSKRQGMILQQFHLVTRQALTRKPHSLSYTRPKHMAQGHI